MSAVVISLMLVGCMPDLNSPEYRKTFQRLNYSMKLHDLERVVGGIELFKLRHGHYPDSLGALNNQGAIPLSTMSYVYDRLDSGYALDLVDTTWSKFKFDTTLVVPPDFWSGLGCRRSNLMPPDHPRR